MSVVKKNDSSNRLIASVLVAALAIGLVAGIVGFSNASPDTANFQASDSESQQRLVTVTGTSTVSMAPDKAVILLSVETLDKSAAKSQSDNAAKSAGVIAALKAAGLAESDIKTVSYSLNEEFQWNELLRKSESIGYRTVNTVQATVNRLSTTGSVIDSAVKAGANSVSQVSFKLSESNESRLKAMALENASGNANAKAQSIAKGLGIALGQVHSASESTNYVFPYYSAAEAKTADASTPIVPGNVEVSSTVTVQFEIM